MENKELKASSITVGGIYDMLLDIVNNEDNRPVVRLGRVDPTDNPLFRTTIVALDAVTTAVHSFNFNCYPPTLGLLEAKRFVSSNSFLNHCTILYLQSLYWFVISKRICLVLYLVHIFLNRAIADHLSSHLPHKLSAENVFLTIGGTQAVDIILPSIARHGANILLPKPGYPQYELRASHCHLEVRHFDLLPERGWEVDLESLENLADQNTVALVLISPSSPCGNVFAYEHLKRVSLA